MPRDVRHSRSGIKYTSRREARTKAAAAEGKLARQQAKLVKAESKQVRAATGAAGTATPGARKPGFAEITAAGKLQRAAHRAGTQMTLDEAMAAIREINETISRACARAPWAARR